MGEKELRRKVLQLVSSFTSGGTERQMLQLTRLLREDGRYDVRVACLDGEGSLRAEVDGMGLGEIAEFPLNNFYDLNMAVQLRRAAGYLREHEFTHIHTHDFYSNIFGMMAATLARTPARIASKRETTGMRTPAQSFVHRGALRLAHAIVANAEAVRRNLVAEGIRDEKIVTIYNGLDTSRVVPPAGMTREDARAAFGLPADEGLRFVTILANLRHDVKDHPTFLRAARRVRDEVPEARFVIAGEGGLESSLRLFAAGLDIEREVFFTGLCSRLAVLMHASDVCVLSSKAEGFSNSILEYMAAARPVVVTDVGGAREVVVEGETGYIVSSGDDEAMAARLVSLLREPERAREMGACGRRVVEEKFTCAAQLERTHDLYERLLAPARATKRMRETLKQESL